MIDWKKKFFFLKLNKNKLMSKIAYYKVENIEK